MVVSCYRENKQSYCSRVHWNSLMFHLLLIVIIIIRHPIGLKIEPRSLHLLYLSPRVKIKLKDIIFQNFLKCPLLSKIKKKTMGLPTSLSFSQILINETI